MFNTGTGALSPYWILEMAHLNFECIYQREDTRVGIRYYREDKTTRLMAYGDLAVVITELENISTNLPRPELTTMPREIYQNLPQKLKEHYGPNWGWDWEFFWTDTPIVSEANTENTVFISVDSAEYTQQKEIIYDALMQANPITEAVEFFSELSWFIVYTPNGEIASLVGADMKGRYTHLYGLGTNPKYRGAGYASTVMTTAINYCLAHEKDAVCYGMWNWNEGARRLYKKLGIKSAGIFTNGRIEPFVELN